MANIFGILAAVVLAATAVFAFYNKGAYNDQLSEVETQELRQAQNERTFEEEKEKANANEAETKVAQEEAVKLKGELEEQLAQNTSLQSDIDDKKAAAESKKGQLEAAEDALSGFGDLGDLESKLEKLQTDLAALRGEVLQKNGEIAAGSARRSTLDVENSELSGVLEGYAKKVSNPGLRTRVTRVVSELGFVIIGGGDNAGVIRDSTLEVVRHGEVIAKLQVTGTETSTAAANIVPDSLAEGEAIRVGDSVIASSN
ncbi:MAG: hypothetical protein AAGC74_10740 [Verrucomicrobiota bacterium]